MKEKGKMAKNTYFWRIIWIFCLKFCKIFEILSKKGPKFDLCTNKLPDFDPVLRFDPICTCLFSSTSLSIRNIFKVHKRSIKSCFPGVHKAVLNEIRRRWTLRFAKGHYFEAVFRIYFNWLSRNWHILNFRGYAALYFNCKKLNIVTP